MDPINYMNIHGFFFASNPEQKTIAEKFAKQGLWRHVTPDLVSDGNFTEGFYVLSHVNSKNTMPISLHKIVMGEMPFQVGEIVKMLAQVHGFFSPIEVYAEVKFLIGETAEVVLLNDKTSCIVPICRLIRTWVD